MVLSRVVVKRALISVYDKTGLVSFAERLAGAGVEIVSSGGTAVALTVAGIEVNTVAEVTGAPEMLGGRVKTLHPSIHGAILARTDDEQDLADLQANGIEPFQLVVVSLYPFRETLATPGVTEPEIIEKIDIGGPTMIRAAAKNHRFVGVVTSAGQYDMVAEAVERGGLDDELRRALATEAFFHTAAYDAAIVGWIGEDRVLPLRHVTDLRYGENPHQPGSIYVEDGSGPWWAGAEQLQGKEMSFNNYVDAEAAWRLVSDKEGCVAIVKHTNACGAAYGDEVAEAFERAWACDPLSAFGGVIGINGSLDATTAKSIAEKFVEVVVCTGVDDEARVVLGPKENLRVLEARPPGQGDPDLRRVESGVLIQERDTTIGEQWEVVSERQLTDVERDELEFAWIVAMHTKSNAIVVVKDRAAVGVGAGDQSRIGAAERALSRAGERSVGAVAASDAFFPFRDGLDVLAQAGVTAVVEPGGSRNDAELIAAANEHGIALVFTGRRHFKH
ncbi:MAG TPA: bifunctional phosphoribosylaminoimidazolecarboxamide formyltransferase/IMP cyclohydrolase [Acidimicrobiia bacterium]|nr:bifunctional phosphoribosylaminoimidazolecarboxamide formyltransferase/IMP cyclohydrolase [Acidimicrobiia bacterium]